MTKHEYKEVIDEISDLYESRIKENIESHQKDFEEEIEMMKHLKTYHLLLSVSMKEITDFIYSELSITAHGNIPTVALQSFGGNKEDEELFEYNACGVKYPFKSTREMVRSMLHYFSNPI